MRNNIELLNLIVKEIFHGVTVDEIIQVEYGGIPQNLIPKYLKIGENCLPMQDVAQLKMEAEALFNSYLWKLLVNRIRYIAQLKSCEQAKTEDDVVFGKAMLYCVEEINKMTELIKNLKVEERKKDNAESKEKSKKR